VAAFHGVTGYRAFVQYGLGEGKSTAGLGDQQRRIGQTRLFVVPNPSGLNASYPGFAHKLVWFRKLRAFLRA
jgi:TDG/mug DNA glycosylase family protein